MHAYTASMGARTLFAIFIALAVLFAPGLTRAGAAFAAVPDHHIQMMDSGHCTTAPSHSGDDEKSFGDETAGKTCCISMCMGIATAPAAPPKAVALHGLAPSFDPANQYHGRIAEIATPPPKFA